MTKGSLGRKGFISSITFRSHSITKGSQGGTLGTELEAATKAEAVEECCFLACWACFLIPSRTTCPVMATPPVSWALFPQSLIKKILHRLAYLPVSWRHFLRIPSSQMSSFVLSWQTPTSIVCIFLDFSLYKCIYVYIHTCVFYVHI